MSCCLKLLYGHREEKLLTKVTAAGHFLHSIKRPFCSRNEWGQGGGTGTGTGKEPCAGSLKTVVSVSEAIVFV